MCFCLLALSVYSQSNEPNGPSTTVDQYLQQLERVYSVSFSYNASLFSKLSYEIPACHRLEDCLEKLSSTFPIDIEDNGTGSYLIIPKRNSIRFGLWDMENSVRIPYAMVQVNEGPVEYLLPVKGVYTVPNLFVSDVLTIKTSFYETMELKASEYLERKSIPLICMKPIVQNLSEVSIQEYLTTGINLKVENHSLQVDMSQLGLMAGETDGDVLNLLKSIPGIQSPDGKPGNINIRNSTFDHSALFFDDIPIYHAGHFFGTISPYNSMAVSAVSIERGSLDARYNGKVGGLIDVRTRNDVPDSVQGQFGVNTYYTGGTVSVPLVANKLGLHLSARSNYRTANPVPKMVAFNTLNFQGSRLDPSKKRPTENLTVQQLLFNDLHGKLVWEPSPNQHFHLNGISIHNSYHYELDAPNNTIEEEIISMANWGWNFTWEGQISPKWRATTSVVQSRLFLSEQKKERENDALTEDATLENELMDARLRTAIEYSPSSSHKLSFGYEGNQLFTDFTKYELEGSGFEEESRTGDAVLHTGFMKYQWLGYEPLSVQIGMNGGYFTDLEEFFADPRIHITYKFHRHFWLKASGGKAHQFLMRNFNDDFNDFKTSNQFWFLAHPNIPGLEASQVMAGALYQNGGWTFDVEGYYKLTEGLHESGSGNSRNRVFGSLASLGTDFFVKKRWKGIETWISYSLTNTDINFTTEQAVHFDQTHNFNAVIMLRLERFSASLSWLLQSGMPVILPEASPNNDPIETSYSGRFPNLHQLDASATYKFWKKNGRYKGTIGASVLNAYDQQNIVNIYQLNVKDNNPYRYSVGFAPNVHLNLLF